MSSALMYCGSLELSGDWSYLDSRRFKDLCRTYKPVCLFLAETLTANAATINSLGEGWDYFMIPVKGGGLVLALLWRKELKLSILYENWCIHGLVNDNDANVSWYFIGVYLSNNPMCSRVGNCNLITCSNSNLMTTQWVCGGDFNCILSDNEK